MRISTRQIRPEDREILAEIYASTRREELRPVPWSDEQKEVFLHSQFEAQHHHYRAHYADAEFLLLLQDDEVIGRLYVDRRPEELRLVDIALLPRHRGSGIGGGLIRSLLEEAAAASLPVRIHVEANNPAMRLYTRLGFEKIDETGVYHLMEWRPDSS